MAASLPAKRGSRLAVRPAAPTPKRELIGVVSFLLLIVAIDRFSTHVYHLTLAGLIYLIAVILIATWAGLRAALIACAMLVAYAVIVYEYPISSFGKDQSRRTSAIVSTAILYPVFALSFGILANRLREAKQREFDAVEKAAEAEAELWASEEMRKLIVESSLDAIVGVDANGIITMWNPNAAKLLGWTQSEAMGQPISERLILSPPLPSELPGSPDFSPETAPLHKPMEATAQTKDGKLLSMDLYIAQQKTDGGAVYIAFLRDISEAKRAQVEIQELNKSLERRVEERTSQLQAANQELVGFSYSVSHDLRAPLRGIVANSRIAREEVDAKEHPFLAERLERLEANSLKMAELIEDLLQFARMGQISIEPREINLSAVAASIAEDLMATTPGLVQIEPNLVVCGDEELVRMLLHNLMENAWKYVRPGEEPKVQVGRTSDGAYFVRDQGVGFDMQFVDKIWMPFERLHSEANYPGTGIGLANARRIVERHGGRIWAESSPDAGTTVFFDFPADRVCEESA